MIIKKLIEKLKRKDPEGAERLASLVKSNEELRKEILGEENPKGKCIVNFRPIFRHDSILPKGKSDVE